jgi:hypothetical protein
MGPSSLPSIPRSHPSHRLRGALLVLLFTLALPAPLRAADDQGARLAFLEQRLDEGRDRARLWQYGWTSVYAGAAVVHGALALSSGDQDEQVVNGVGALRALTALTLIRLRSDPGRFGADPVRAAGPPGSTARLEAAEGLLARTAHHAERRYSVERHLFNVGLNAVFGSLVLAFGDSDDAIFSTLTGIAGGVATLVTRSPQPIRNAAEYRDRYGPPVTWEFAPHPHGLAFRVRF